MSFDRGKLLTLARAESGYLEKKSGDPKYLYDKTANAGSANYTKYGYEMHRLYPDVMDYPAYWCDAYVDWLFMTCYGVANARKLLGGDFDDYTVASANLYKKKGAWHAVPQPGDQIFFQNSSRICHTGIVLEVKNETVWTSEGNTSGGSSVIPNGGGVCIKSYPLNYSRIAGYGRPAWGKDISITEGWRRASDGKRWWYQYADGTWPANTWMALETSGGKHWFYFDKDGYMLTGWQKIDGKWYYLDTTEGPTEGALWRSDNAGSQEVWTL